jgi:hypothetical protein
VPGKGGAAGRAKRARPARFHHAPSAEVQAAAIAIVRRTRGAVPSQGELLRAVRRAVRTEDPLARIGGRRLRHLLLDTPGIHLDVTYAERADPRPPAACPVCAGALRPIQNRTLENGEVTVGARCPRCGYWTQRRRRVPIRYTFRAGSAPRRGPRPDGA